MAVALALVSAAPGFVVLIVAFALLSPSTGAFVSLSQATLMDLEPERRELNMTRWSIAGGVGAVAGPLLLVLFTALGGGWRALFATFAVLALALTAVAASTQSSAHPHAGRPSLRAAVAAIRRPLVVRWLVLLEFADLLLDVLLGYVALYLVDEAGASAQVGGLGVAVWTGAGLVGGLGVIVLLRRVDGLRYLRASALAALVLFPAFLLVPGAVGEARAARRGRARDCGLVLDPEGAPLRRAERPERRGAHARERRRPDRRDVPAGDRARRGAVRARCRLVGAARRTGRSVASVRRGASRRRDRPARRSRRSSDPVPASLRAPRCGRLRGASAAVRSLS